MEQKIISVGALVERRDASLNAEHGSASQDTGTPTKPSLSLSLRESIERRVKNSLVYDTILPFIRTGTTTFEMPALRIFWT